MTLIESLLACIAEDETAANAATDDQTRWTPQRLLAESAMKRRILARHSPADYIDDEPACTHCLIVADGGHGHRPAPWPCPDVRDLMDLYGAITMPA